MLHTIILTQTITPAQQCDATRQRPGDHSRLAQCSSDSHTCTRTKVEFLVEGQYTRLSQTDAERNTMHKSSAWLTRKFHIRIHTAFWENLYPECHIPCATVVDVNRKMNRGALSYQSLYWQIPDVKNLTNMESNVAAPFRTPVTESSDKTSMSLHTSIENTV